MPIFNPNRRDPQFLGPRIGDKIFVSLLILTLYLGIGDELVPKNYINISAVLFMWCVLPAFGAAAYVPSLFLERGLYVRERNDGLYAAHTYLIAKMLDELVVAVAAAVVVSAWVFYAIQLQGSFTLFFLAYFGTLCVGISASRAAMRRPPACLCLRPPPQRSRRCADAAAAAAFSLHIPQSSRTLSRRRRRASTPRTQSCPPSSSPSSSSRGCCFAWRTSPSTGVGTRTWSR
jgi:hypothetical protein